MARNIQAAKRLESRIYRFLLLGESGTGKEFFARTLHAASELRTSRSSQSIAARCPRC